MSPVLRSRLGRRLRSLALAFVAVFTASNAYAQLNCTFSITNMSFGTVNVLSVANVDRTATLNMSCTGGTASSTVRVCPNIAAGAGGTNTAGTRRRLLSGANILEFQIYSNSGRTTIWGSWLWTFTTRPPTLAVTLNGAGSGSGTATLYGRVFSGQPTVPPGSYSSTFNTANVVIRYRQGTATACQASATGWTTGNAAFTTSATVQSFCNVTATNVDFGAKGVLDAIVDATGTITATCTFGTAYIISLNGGLQNAPPAARLMMKGAEDIAYGLYKNAARTQVWGSPSLPGSTVAGTGVGAGQVNTIYGRVPVQPTPSPGLYSDTVVVTVTY